MNSTQPVPPIAPQTAFSDIDSIGPYKIEAILGEGAMGKVYLATHTQLKRKVAIKTMRQIHDADPLRVGRFQREMEAVGRLDHPNIVRATDAGEDNGVQFIAMEFVEGTDVQNILDQNGPLSPGMACDIIRQAAEGLQNIQEHGLVHRDLKPSNLIVSRRGQVKILDLGIARLRNDDQLGTLTADGGLMGTPDFIAPEQVMETGCVDIRADIYSLGCTLYRMLSGRLPFEGPEYGTNVAKVIGHTQKDPEELVKYAPDTPPELLELVKHMMAKDPEERIQTPQEIADAMGTWADGSELPHIVAKNINQTTVVVKRPSNGNAANSQTASSDTPSQAPKLSWKWPAAAAATIVGALALGVPSLLSNSREPVSTVSTANVPTTENNAVANAAPNTAVAAAEQQALATQTINVSAVQPAIEQVATATTELNSTAKTLTGSVQNIDNNTQQIAETLQQLRDSFASASTGGQIIANPQTVGELYANARAYTKQGKHGQARDTYTQLMDKGAPFVDIHKSFQQLITVQEGVSRARDFYDNLDAENKPVVQFAKTLLLDKKEKRAALVEFIKSNPNFGPAISELANSVANGAEDMTLSEKQLESKLLGHFVELHGKGDVLRYYLDQSEAANAIEEATQRVQQLEARSTSHSDVHLAFNYTRGGMGVLIQTPEECKTISYSIDGRTYRSTGESIGFNHAIGQPYPRKNISIRKTRKPPKSIFVKYTDLRDAEHGPFEFPLDWNGQKEKKVKRLLDLTRGSWVNFHESNGRSHLHFATLYQFRDAIEEVQFGFNVAEPNQVRTLKDSQDLLVKVSDDVQSVVVRLKFKDGTQSEIEQFDR